MSNTSRDVWTWHRQGADRFSASAAGRRCQALSCCCYANPNILVPHHSTCSTLEQIPSGIRAVRPFVLRSLYFRWYCTTIPYTPPLVHTLSDRNLSQQHFHFILPLFHTSRTLLPLTYDTRIYVHISSSRFGALSISLGHLYHIISIGAWRLLGKFHQRSLEEHTALSLASAPEIN